MTVDALESDALELHDAHVRAWERHRAGRQLKMTVASFLSPLNAEHRAKKSIVRLTPEQIAAVEACTQSYQKAVGQCAPPLGTLKAHEERAVARLKSLGGTPGASALVRGIERDERERQHLDKIQAASDWPPCLDLVAMAKREPEAPKFIVDGWLPCGYATLLAGHGGVGKSALALHLGACISMGATWAGLTVEPRRVLYLSCEDREGVLHWRLQRICSFLRIGIDDLVGQLNVVELVGRDAVLWERDPRTGNTMTAAYGRLQDLCSTITPDVLMIDGISDTFAGNENVRTDVKRFVNSLVPLVPETGAVLLIGHVAKPTATNAQTGEGYSGSTGWHNAARARWYLFSETSREDTDERPQRTGSLLLELQKSNLGPMDQTIKWAWDEAAHLFVPEAAPLVFDRAHQDREEQEGIRRAMAGCMDAGDYVPAAMTGPRTAYLALSQRPEFPESLKGGTRVKIRRFWRQIENLRLLRHVAEISMRRKGRHTTVALALTTEGRAACA